MSTVLASDQFERNDNADLGTNWTAQTAAMSVSAGGAHYTTISVDSDEYWNALTPPNDQFSTALLRTPDGTGQSVGYGVSVRSSTSAHTAYVLVGSAAGYFFWRVNAGVFTTMDSGAGTVFADRDRLTLEILGSTPMLKKNGVAFGTPGTDSSIASGRLGIWYSATAGGSGPAIEYWEGGTLSPTITQQPTTVTVLPGQTAQFSVTASGTGTVHYQWKQNGGNVGTDSNSYTTAATVPGDNLSMVTCDVTDDLTTITSLSVYLLVAGTVSLAWNKA